MGAQGDQRGGERDELAGNCGSERRGRGILLEEILIDVQCHQSFLATINCGIIVAVSKCFGQEGLREWVGSELDFSYETAC